MKETRNSQEINDSQINNQVYSVIKNNKAFLRITEMSLVVNLINIPAIFKNIGILSGLGTMFIINTITSISMYLMSVLCTKYKSDNIVDFIPYKWCKYLTVLLYICTTVFKLLFTFSHIINYLNSAYNNNTFYNSMIIYCILMIFITFKIKIINIRSYLVWIYIGLSFVFTFIAFYSTITHKKYINVNQIDINGDYFSEAALLLLWLSPPKTICKVVNTTDQHIHIILSHLMKNVIYCTLAILGVIGFANTENIFLLNYKDRSLMILIFYLIGICLMVVPINTITNEISQDLLYADTPHYILYYLVAGVFVFSSTFISQFYICRMIVLYVCAINFIILPGVFMIYSKPQRILNRHLSYINIILGILICILATLTMLNN